MRPVELNLASRPFRNNTLVWLGYIGLLTVAVGFTYWNVSSFRHYRQELAELDREQGNIDQEQSDLVERHRKILHGVKKFDRVAIGRRTSKANEVIDWKAFSWTRLFNRLEEVLPNNIKMMSVRPIFHDSKDEVEGADPRRSMPVTVEGLARDWDAFFELETNLIKHESFGRLEPRNIKTMDNGERSFSIQFRYYPDEPVATPASAVTEDVVRTLPLDEANAAVADPAQAAEATDTVGEPVVDLAERGQLPDAARQPAEVVDEWAAQAETAGPRQAKRDTARTPRRRTLPKVQPGVAETDNEREPR